MSAALRFSISAAVMTRVTIGTSFSVFGVRVPVTTTVPRATESLTPAAADKPAAGISAPRPADTGAERTTADMTNAKYLLPDIICYR